MPLRSSTPLCCLDMADLLLPLPGCSADPRQPPAAERDARVVTRGLNPILLTKTVETAKRLPRLRSMVVLRHGETIAAHRFNGGPPLDQPVNIKSASKTVLSALVGLAIERKILTGTDQPILSVLRPDAPSRPDPRLERVTVGHLLSMRAGLERTSGDFYGRWVASQNWVRFALARPFTDEPGGAMLYSTGSSHLLSAMLTRASGQTTFRLAQEWLGRPLGINIPSWPRDPQGIYFGRNDMLLSPRDLAKFGELYRNQGKVGDEQIIPAAWVNESWEERTTSPWSGSAYSYGWFLGTIRGHKVRFAWGYCGQMLYVLPDLALTVVMTSDATGARDGGYLRALHRLLSDGLVPAAETGS